jgi:hypothetical protein
MLYREIIAVCSEIHTKHINTLCGRNVELLNVTPDVVNPYRQVTAVALPTATATALYILFNSSVTLLCDTVLV